MSTAVAAPSGATLRSRLAERGVDRALLLALPALVVFAVLFAYPFAYGLGLSFDPQEGSGPFANYDRFFSDSFERNTIWTTLRLALPATLINVLASVPIAVALRRRVRGRRLLTTLLVVPVSLGTVLVAEGLLRYLGPRGWFNRVLMDIGIVDEPVRLIHNSTGVLLSLVITGFPFSFLLILAYVSGIDPRLEQAAATLGAGPWQRFRRVLLPLLAPGLATTFVLAFVLAFAVFPSAVMVGEPSSGTRVISIAAYQAALEKYDFSMGSTIAMIMGVVELAVIAVVLLVRGGLVGPTRPSTGGKG